MKKLNVMDLRVESFPTLEEPAVWVGTVRANADGRPSQDWVCQTNSADGYCNDTQPCACGDPLTSWGYTCDRPSCAPNCPSKYPCPEGAATYTACALYTNCTCGAGDTTETYTAVHPCGTQTA